MNMYELLQYTMMSGVNGLAILSKPDFPGQSVTEPVEVTEQPSMKKSTRAFFVTFKVLKPLPERESICLIAGTTSVTVSETAVSPSGRAATLASSFPRTSEYIPSISAVVSPPTNIP